MVPHIIFHDPDPSYFPGPEVWSTGQNPATSGISQPPVAATMARLVWEMDKAAGHDRLGAIYPKLVKWHRWWHEVRCVYGPAAIIHPWESGRDNCPDWDSGMAGVDGYNAGAYTRRDTGHVDPAMRPQKEEYDRYIVMVKFGVSAGWDQTRIVAEGPFLMADPGITFILLRAHENLIFMGETLGEDTYEIAQWAAVLRAALPEIWNAELGAYDARNLRDGSFAGGLGSGALLAYLADAGNPILDAHLERVWDAVTYGIPSADPLAEVFDARRYWRGPSWPFLNALIAIGFRDMGRHDLDARLRRETAEAITKKRVCRIFRPA